MKTNKSITKRLKLTKNGKIVGRKAGQNHFNARENGRTQTAKGRAASYEHYFTNKTKSRYLSK
jgi:Ribosomal protein L35.